MRSINFDTGYKEYAINGDENRTVRINVCDVGIVRRFEETLANIEKLDQRLKTEEKTSQLLADADKTVREQLDYVFGTNISEAAFGNINCLSPVGGKTLLEGFLDAVGSVIIADIKSAAQAQNITVKPVESKADKYISPYVNLQNAPDKPFVPYTGTPSIDISSLSQEEKNALLRQMLK